MISPGIKKKNVLITGATGFIGRRVVSRLLTLDDYSVTGLSRYSENAAHFKSRGAGFIQADITRKKDLKMINKSSFDIIIHCAGCVSNKPRNRSNPEGTANICSFALGAGVEKLIYLSSVSVVSGNSQVPLTDDLPYSATTLYGESKVDAEKEVIRYREMGVPTVILRPPIVYGEDEPHFLPALSKLLKLRIFPLPFRGKALFHLVYVENLVDSIIFALSSRDMYEGTYISADREILTVREVFNCMAEGFGAGAPFRLNYPCSSLLCSAPLIGRRFKFFTKDRAYSTEKIESLGFFPSHRAEEALVRSCMNSHFSAPRC